MRTNLSKLWTQWRNLDRVAVDMDIHGYIHGCIHGYIHVWIADLGCTMDISMDIHTKSGDMDMDMDGKFHIHGNPELGTRGPWAKMQGQPSKGPFPIPLSP